ncbi:MAG: ABC transporter ATP-binding protein, partial [bacterium]|nr:ABC transporter ATP-binding protein [bacterium]
IFFQGESILNLPPHRMVAKRVAHVPEGRGVFATLTVQENLELATWTSRDRAHLNKVYTQVFDLFPRLQERKKQLAGTLSGGEQQMLAIARALMTRCRLLLLDEPSMGLSPLLAKEVFRTLREINRQGTSIFLVEQNVALALQFSHRGYVLENGRIVLSGSASQLSQDTRVKEAYLGRKK